MPNESYEGGVFSATLKDGRAGAALALSATGVVAKMPAGDLLEIPYTNLTLVIGGASGHMLFCRGPAQEPTFFCDDTRMLTALTAVPNTTVAVAAQQLRASLSRKRWSSVALWLTILALVLGVGFAVPALLNHAVPKAIASVPMSVDEKIGKVLVKAMDLGGSEFKNAKTLAPLQQLVDGLKAYSAMPNANYRVHLVDNSQVNAFALPGGELVVNSGLIEAAKQPTEVAAVLAHEMGHVTHRHGLERIGQSLGIVGAVELLLGDVGGLAATAKELFTLAAVNNYSRAQEEEADIAAVTTLHAAGLDARALSDFFTRMKAEATPLDVEALNWLSSHPDFDTRMAAVNALAEKTPIAKVTLPSFDLAALQKRIARPGERDDVADSGAEITESAAD